MREVGREVLARPNLPLPCMDASLDLVVQPPDAIRPPRYPSSVCKVLFAGIAMSLFKPNTRHFLELIMIEDRYRVHPRLHRWFKWRDWESWKPDSGLLFILAIHTAPHHPGSTLHIHRIYYVCNSCRRNDLHTDEIPETLMICNCFTLRKSSSYQFSQGSVFRVCYVYRFQRSCN